MVASAATTVVPMCRGEAFGGVLAFIYRFGYNRSTMAGAVGNTNDDRSVVQTRHSPGEG